MILIVFWSAVFLIVYTYALFPLLIFLRGSLLRRIYREAEIAPEISIVIAAHNEAGTISAKLENILSSDYPAERREVIVASDGSEDETNEIVQQFARRGVSLLALPRVGKAQALNTAVEAACGEILVFSDANSMLSPRALQALVKPFADSRIGGVAGNQCYLPEGSRSLTYDGEKSYWNFDRLLKQFESQAGNVISATGSLYAIRRQLFLPIPEGVTDDFVTSTAVIVQGYRLIFAPEAVTSEPVAPSSKIEFNRKVRISTRGLQAVLARRVLLNPFRYGFYALQLFSHKVLRRLVAFPLLVLLAATPFTWPYGPFYRAAMLAQLGFYGLALAGIILRNHRLGRTKILTIPFYFSLVNVAAVLAALNVLLGRQIARWEPQRQETKQDLPLPATSDSRSL